MTAIEKLNKMNKIYQAKRIQIAAEFSKMTLEQATKKMQEVEETSIEDAINEYAKRAMRIEIA